MTENRGERLMAAMKARRIPKLSVLAAALNVSESAVSRWRRNGPMTVDNVEAVCRFLDISADWLLLGRGSMDLADGCDHARGQEWALALEHIPARAQRELLRFLQSMQPGN
jgi:transcriptional regulator with XRE-family HTH domain